MLGIQVDNLAGDKVDYRPPKGWDEAERALLQEHHRRAPALSGLRLHRTNADGVRSAFGQR
jgi:hypothetical protein